MSSTTHTITLTAKDGTQQVFSAIEKGAKADAAALQQMGREGSAGLKQVDQAAAQSGKSMDDFGKRAREVGAGLGVLVAAASLTGRAYVDQERQLANLQRTYGDAAKGLDDFADSIQKTTTFSDDAARSAELIFGTLARNYGLTADQIKELTARTADLAAATGFSLPDAAERVAAAIRGEAESAEALGLTMNQQAIDRGNLTLKMGNQEAAQFRLNALYEQSAFAEGAAAERAHTLAGETQQLVNRGQDLVQWAGGAIGPLGQVASVLGSVALAAPLVGAGLGEVAGAFRALTAAEEAATLATEAQTVASVEAEVASAGLLATLGPIGLVAAAGAAAFGIYKLVQSHHDEVDAAEAANKASQDLAATLNSLSSAGSPQSGTAAAWAAALEATLAGIPAQITAIRTQMTDLSGTDQPVAIDPSATDEASKKLADLEAQLEALQTAAGNLAPVETALAKTFMDTGVGANLAQQRVAQLFDAFAQSDKGAAAIKTLVDGIIWVGTHLGNYDDAANAATEATKALAIAQLGAADGVDVLKKAVGDLTLGFADTAKGQQILTDLQTIATQGSDAQRASIQQQYEAAVAAGKGFDSFANSVHFMASQLDLHAAATERNVVAWSHLTPALYAALTGLMPLSEQFGKTAKAADDAANVIDTRWPSLGAAVHGLTDHLHKTAAAAEETPQVFDQRWPSLEARLRGLDGELGKTATAAKDIADVFDTRWPSIEAWVSGAVDSTTRFGQALADTETNLDKVARGSTSAAVQLAAFRDVQDGLVAQEGVYSAQASTYSQQVNAMAAARDILLDRQAKGVELTQQDIDFLNTYDEANARATGGVEDATVAQGELAGQYALNMKKGDEMNSSLDGVSRTTGDLTDAIRALIDALNGVPSDVETNVAVAGLAEANADADSLNRKLNDLDGRNVTSTVNLVTNLLTVDKGSRPAEFALGGMVSAAGGRMVTVNEGGRETATLPSGDHVWLPTGSTVWPHAASVEGARGGGGTRQFNNYGTIHIHANDPNDFYDRWQSQGYVGR